MTVYYGCRSGNVTQGLKTRNLKQFFTNIEDYYANISETIATKK